MEGGRQNGIQIEVDKPNFQMNTITALNGEKQLIQATSNIIF